MIARAVAIGLFAVLAVATAVGAHEVRPAYLELQQSTPENFEMVWKVPARWDFRLDLEPRLSSCRSTPTAPAIALGGARVERSTVTCPEGLAGTRIEILGLASTLTDVLVRIEGLDGAVQTARLMPDRPSLVVRDAPGPLEVARTYLGLGIEHILAGFDHLLFVLALLLLVQGWRRLTLTITAFTVAHSLTLAAATFELIRVQPALVEALIALSIVLVAVEIVRAHQGGAGLTARWPWLVAFAFGLLHGLGFASALSEIGLPANAVPAALLFFNVGVELGQLLVVAAALTAVRLAHAPDLPLPAWSWRVPTYAIGSLAASWTLERLTQLA